MDLFDKLTPSSKKFIYIVTGIAFIGTFLLSKSLIISLIMGVIGFAGSFGFSLTQKENQKENKTQKTEKTVEPVVEKTMSEVSIETLIKLEEDMAIGGIFDDEDLKNRILPIIDKFYDTIHKMKENFGEKSIAYEINNLATEHLPNRIRSFINLSEDDRYVKKSDLEESLLKIEKTVDDAAEVLNNETLSKDERESLLIQIKY